MDFEGLDFGDFKVLTLEVCRFGLWRLKGLNFGGLDFGGLKVWTLEV